MNTDLPAVPDGIPQGVRYRVYNMIVSGFHPSAIVDQMERVEGVKLELADIITYAKSVPERVSVPSLKDELGGLDAVADPLDQAQKALLLLGGRLAARMEAERLSPDGKKDARIDGMLLSYIDSSMKLAQLMRSLGVDPWEKRAPANSSPGQGMPLTLGEIIRADPKLIEGEFRKL